MEFNLREYVLKIIKDSIGNEADYKVRQNALNWFDKSILIEDDLAEIDLLIEEKNTAESAESEENSKEIENSSGNEEIQEENSVDVLDF